MRSMWGVYALRKKREEELMDNNPFGPEDPLEITQTQAQQLDSIVITIEERMKETINELDWEKFYDLAADWFGTNDPAVKELLETLQCTGIL